MLVAVMGWWLSITSITTLERSAGELSAGVLQVLAMHMPPSTETLLAVTILNLKEEA